MRFPLGWLLLLVLAPAAGQAAEPPRSQLCRKHLARSHGGGGEETVKFLDAEVAAFRRTAEEALRYRAESVAAAEVLKKQVREKTPRLEAGAVEQFHRSSLAHLGLRKKLLAVVEGHECWGALTADDLAEAHLSEAARRKGVLLSVASSLLLYDNYLLAVSLYEQDARLRKALKKQGSGFDVARADAVLLTLEYGSEEARRGAVAALAAYEQGKGVAAPPDDEAVAFLEKVIAESPSYRQWREPGARPVFRSGLEFFGPVTHDALASLEGESIDLFRTLFAGSALAAEPPSPPPPPSLAPKPTPARRKTAPKAKRAKHR